MNDNDQVTMTMTFKQAKVLLHLLGKDRNMYRNLEYAKRYVEEDDAIYELIQDAINKAGV